jgi:hypothetical protein
LNLEDSMTRPRDLKKDQSRPRDDFDRAADISINDAEAQQPDPPSGPPRGRDDMKVVDASEIGAGTGLDEAELGRVDPLDGKPWDGNPEEPLLPGEQADEDFPAERRGPSKIENE